MFRDTFVSLGEAVATPADYVKLFTCFFLAFPLALPLPHLTAVQKHFYNFLVGSFFLWGIMDLSGGYFQLLASCLTTYLITKYNVGGRAYMPWLVFGLAMGHLTINHLVRAFGNIPLTTIEITAAQMVLTMNLTSFAWSVHDGKNRTAEQCDDQQRSMRITEFPSLLEFLGYAFYFPGLLIGPSTRFVDYRAWSTGALYPKDTRISPHSGTRLPPHGRIQACAKELGLGLLSLVAWSYLTPKYDYEMLVTPLAPGQKAPSFLSNVILTQLAGLAARTKYYGIWNLTNAACILSGLGFNGFVGGIKEKQGRAKWNRCQNVYFMGIEFANNWKELLDSWNMNTNVWLRNNVYKRVSRPGKKPGFKSTMATFITSAFWHGVAPGYYLAFVLGGFHQSVGRTLRSHLRPIFFKGNDGARKSNPTSVRSLFDGSYTIAQLAYCTLSVVAVQLTMNYTAAPFILLEFGRCLRAWHKLGYYGIVMAIGPIIAFRLGAGRWLDGVSGAGAEKKRQKAVKEQQQLQSKQGGQENGNPQVPDVDEIESEAKKTGEEFKGVARETVDDLAARQTNGKKEL